MNDATTKTHEYKMCNIITVMDKYTPDVSIEPLWDMLQSKS